MTLKEYLEAINELVKEHLEFLEMQLHQTQKWDGDEIEIPQLWTPYGIGEEKLCL